MFEYRANEYFIERSLYQKSNFLLKGSYLSRQFFRNPLMRNAIDLDWIYVGEELSKEEAGNVFGLWVDDIIKPTYPSIPLHFQNFDADHIWTMIDYAMSDDFPTLSTNLFGTMEGAEAPLWIEVSFNLPYFKKSSRLEYKTIDGRILKMNSYIPLGVQIAWKIHQCLVRPRFKDFVDIVELLHSPFFTENDFTSLFQMLFEECVNGDVPYDSLKLFFEGEYEELFESRDKMLAGWRTFKECHVIFREEDANDLELFSTNYSFVINTETMFGNKVASFWGYLKRNIDQSGIKEVFYTKYSKSFEDELPYVVVNKIEENKDNVVKKVSFWKRLFG